MPQPSKLKRVVQRQPNKTSGVSHSKKGTVRIIGGRWRGRKLHFPAREGLRPTSDRTRETLFNWLMPSIHDAVCLDVFAGSGALGFEALSRGAKHVAMIDQSKELIHYLQEQAVQLKTEEASFYHLQVPKQSFSHAGPFNIVFIDPPFHQNLVPETINWLLENHCLAPQALVYIETEQDLQPLPIPEAWAILKQGHAGQVRFYLVQVA